MSELTDDIAALFLEVRENLRFLDELGVAGLSVSLPEPIAETEPPRKAVAGQSFNRQTSSIVKPPTAQSLSNKTQPPAPPSPKPSDSPRSMRNLLANARLSNFSAPKPGDNNPGATQNSSNSVGKNDSVLKTGGSFGEPPDAEKVNPVSAPQDAPEAMSPLDPDTNAPSDSLFGDLSAPNELPASDETLADVRRDVGDCTRCPLYQGRTKIVHSEGALEARVVFVGEAPGADEDATGRPFIGRAGQLLTKIIEAIGLKREEVFIGNVNRCRPPGNRTPTTKEAATCRPFLLREIAIVRPEIIVVLGNTATQNLLETKEGITKLRGRFQDYYGIKVMPTFHPAYLLRDPSKKRETWEDMKKVRDELAKTQK